MNTEKKRYLFIGGINTLAGYLIGVVVYKLLLDSIGIWCVGIVANIIAITFSFFTNKIFVFKTTGNWILEYLKCYIVYGAMALVGVFLLWAFVEKMKISIFIAQLLVIASTVFLSYLGHKNFTFSLRIHK